jgi:hypothetical protein
VGADQFIYYKQFDAHRRVAPDTYVLPGVDPLADVPSWKVFETGIAPSFALEVVSKDWRKDYTESPLAYAELGVTELVVFDPRHESRAERHRFQVFRTAGKRGLVRVDVTNRDRVKSKVLGCFIRADGSDRRLRLRLATGAAGEELVLTAEEAERAEKERERTEKERERAEKERERGEKESALSRVAALELEVAALKAQGRPARAKAKPR